ncbi:hypothetical protein BK816_08545 [Boudabousia tangfeifanii]|uniref:High-affinity zinc uptake system membrane protein ZnuB n=1 Tax=Boudabousia tangfeifanii TaxID=1912795 RepID=A0A1D9MN03_9ACTO|nr:hypothetical protein BK816_08545 [Boudabousia tangfeifanii]
MAGPTSVLAAPFLFRPLVVLLILGLAAGPISTLVNLRSREFSAEALVHSIFPGIVGGFVYLGGIAGIIPGAMSVAVLVVAGLTWLGSRADSFEAATAVILTAFFGLGIIMITYHRDMGGQLEALLFGRLLEITDHDLAPTFAVLLGGLALVLASWRWQVARAFDAVAVAAAGKRGWLLDFTLNLAIAALVVGASTAVGALLVIGYAIIPGATARLLARTTRQMAWVATGVGLVSGLLSMSLIAYFNRAPLSPQAVALLTLSALYVLLALLAEGARRLTPDPRKAQNSPTPSTREASHV